MISEAIKSIGEKNILGNSDRIFGVNFNPQDYRNSNYIGKDTQIINTINWILIANNKIDRAKLISELIEILFS